MQMLENAAEQGTRPEMDAAELSKVRRRERLKSRGEGGALDSPVKGADVAAAASDKSLEQHARWNARLRYTEALPMGAFISEAIYFQPRT